MLGQCLDALELQTDADFEVIVVDNSGDGSIERELQERRRVRIYRSDRNLGFAAAMNQAWSMSAAHYLVTLNDDAVPHPQWLASLKNAVEADGQVGMCASQVRLKKTGMLDSAGMLMALDGSSKQRGHGQAPQNFSRSENILFPSASAALYRREMLEDVGLFDSDFFAYCEDTDLGLRGRRRGWKCVYVPDAVVEHVYSHSAGAVSAFKAWHVERNRLWVAAKNFPPGLLLGVAWQAALRYFWHGVYLLQDRGAAGKFRSQSGGIWPLLKIVVAAHFSLFTLGATLWRKRREIRSRALLSNREFTRLIRQHSISAKEIARL